MASSKAARRPGKGAAVAAAPSAGVVSAMVDLRFVAESINELEADALIDKDTARAILPGLVRDRAREALGLPSAPAPAHTLPADQKAATLALADEGGALSSSYSASGLGLCLASVAMLVALEIAHFVVLEVPAPVTWAALLVLLSAAPLTHAAGTEIHRDEQYNLWQPVSQVCWTACYALLA